MSTIVTDDKHYSDIANAIRGKNGTSTKYKPSEMALAIRAIETGGIPCTLTVETAAGATVKATLNGTTLTATANSSGVATLVLEKEGTWTITATSNGTSKSTTVNVYHEIAEELDFVDPVFSNNSWATISQVSKAGKAQNYWKVGDTKTVTYTNGSTTQTHTFRIIGFDHDNVTNSSSYGRTKAGITLQLAQVVDTSTWNGSQVVYKNSLLRKQNIPNITSRYPSSFLNFLVPVNKLAASSTTYSSKTTETVSDTFFPLAVHELQSSYSYAADEGDIYAFFSAGNSKVLRNSSNTTQNWWTRSLYKMSSTFENRNVYVNTSGSVTSGSYANAYAINYCCCI